MNKYSLPLGTIVKMKPSIAKWTLKNFDIFTIPNRPKKSNAIDGYDDLLIYFYKLMGGEVTGTIIKYGAMNETYAVKWEVKGLKPTWAFYEYKKDFTLSGLSEVFNVSYSNVSGKLIK